MHNKTLYIAGYGVMPEEDRCGFIDRIIDESDAIFMLEKPGSWLDRRLTEHDNYVKNYIELYQDGVDRLAIYNNICDDILLQFEEVSQAVYLTEGNPFLLDYISSTLEKKASEFNIEVISAPGLSSLDKLLFELRVPIEKFGIQVYLANYFCYESPSINIDGILILMQPGNIGSTKVTINGVDKNSIDLLQIELISCFGEEAHWMLVNLSNEAGNPSRILWGKLSNLSEFYDYMHSGSLVVSSSWLPDCFESVEMTSID